MNVMEGVRRVGLVAGLLGATGGIALAYVQLEPLLGQYVQYQRFQGLSASPTVTQELETLKASLDTPRSYVPGSDVRVPRKDWFDAVDALCRADPGWQVSRNQIKAIHFDTRACKAAGANQLAKYQLPQKPPVISIESARRSVNTSEIEMIETTDGQEVPRTDPPAIRLFLLGLSLLLVGFVLPWAAAKTLSWIVAGFNERELGEKKP